jgi:hypothetical protein
VGGVIDGADSRNAVGAEPWRCDEVQVGRTRRDPARLNDAVVQSAVDRCGVGGAVASLLTDANHWINAQRIEVSGGMFI